MRIDTHVHLNEVEGVPREIERAKSLGVCRIVAVGMDLFIPPAAQPDPLREFPEPL